jgi:acyl carrier protein
MPGTLSGGAPAAVAALIADHPRIRRLGPEANLWDLDLHPLRIVQILIQLEGELDVRFSDRELTAGNFATVGALWSTITSGAFFPGSLPSA